MSSEATSSSPPTQTTEVSVRQQRVIALTESHERRLEALRDQMRAVETEGEQRDPLSPYMQLQKKLFDAKFELNASKRSKDELDKQGETQKTKNHDNMAALHAELKRTHDAMRD